MVLVYPIGIPAMYLWLLYTNREEIMQREEDNRPEVAAAEAAKEGTACTVTNNPLLKDAAALSDKDKGTDKELSAAASSSASSAELSSAASRLTFLFEAYEPKYWYYCHSFSHSFIHSSIYSFSHIHLLDP
jgi:hypothetical protein